MGAGWALQDLGRRRDRIQVAHPTGFKFRIWDFIIALVASEELNTGMVSG